MANSTPALLTLITTLGCAGAEDLPLGPCNDDGGTAGPDIASDEPAPNHMDIDSLPGPFTRAELRPALPAAEGWTTAAGTGGLYRLATQRERLRRGWPDHTIILASPLPSTGQTPPESHILFEYPVWSEEHGQWLTDQRGKLIFERQLLNEIQSLALGHFVEHHRVTDGSSGLHVERPTFTLYGSKANEATAQLLLDSSGAFLTRRQTSEGSLQLSSPHTPQGLDAPPPNGFRLAIVTPSSRAIAREPLRAFDCENGECEEPDNPRDECSDGLDNDGDGDRDLCDWNCLPHSDFGAHLYPEARSRIESGKSYALMGGGGLCTQLGDTWRVTFADWALQASEFLNSVRPDTNDPVHYRIFSCWMFENQQQVLSCQHGIVFENGEPSGIGPPVCPEGLDNYPYKKQDNDPHPGLLLYDEATGGAWRDFAINTIALGSSGEPVHGVVFLTNDTISTCETDFCNPAAGLATRSPFAKIWNLGRLVVTDANPRDWLTLAHETGHTLGMLHDNAPDGFMNTDGGLAPVLGISVEPEHPGLDNSVIWERAFSSKHSYPRSSGWYWTGCYEVEHPCAPLGKPGWSCEQAWCEPT